MKTISKVLGVIAISILMLSFTACSSKTVSDDTYNVPEINDTTAKETEEEQTKEEPVNDSLVNYPISITDAFGDLIEIKEEPNTIISLSPEITETIFALGAGERLVGRSDYCDYPLEVQDVESVGNLFEVNIEKIVELDPDIIFFSSMVGEDVVKQLIEQGLTVITLDWDNNFDGVYNYIGTVGLIINQKENTEILMSQMQDKINMVIENVKNLEKPSAYFVTWCGDGGDSAATGDTFLGQLIEMAGAQNAASDGLNWMYNVEQLVEKDPDILICSKYFDMKERIKGTEGYKDLTAVKEDYLYEVDENLFFRQGPRIADGLVELAKIFHPEVFNVE